MPPFLSVCMLSSEYTLTEFTSGLSMLPLGAKHEGCVRRRTGRGKGWPWKQRPGKRWRWKRRPAKRWQGRRDRPRARRGGRKLCWFRYGYAERYHGGSPSVPPSGRIGHHRRRAFRLPGDTRQRGAHVRGLGVAVSFPGQRRRFSSRGGAGFATFPDERPSCSVGASATTAP